MNQLSGLIPLAIFNMSSITHLYLADNNLSRSLPTNSSLPIMLPRIQVISLERNQLSGHVPWGFTRCQDLQYLYLTTNHFSGNILPELGSLPKLRELFLGENNLTGTIPTTLGNLTKLNELEIGWNNFSGRIPDELGSMLNLNGLGLAQAGLSGPIPISLSNASMLRILELSSNKLTGPVPIELGNMPYLETLHLGGNKLAGGLDFITSLSNCRALKVVDLTDNELDGVLPNSVGNLSTHLAIFLAHRNHIKGNIPAEFGNLSSLLSINLSDNELIGMIPSTITRLERLQLLDLGGNRIQGTIPHEFGRMRSLNLLDLQINMLSGSIPESIGNISRLQVLSLAYNTLSSSIPKSIWKLTGLIQLYLNSNFLDGLIPEDVGNLKGIDLLALEMNRLSGNVPTALGNLQMVRFLYLFDNSFDGNIPRTFGGLISVVILDLSNNNLSGSIPNSLANLRYVSSINMSFNRLEGQIPDGGAFSNITIQSLMGNAALCGAPRLGFPPCSTNVVDTNLRTKTGLLRYILPAIVATLVVVACFCLLLTFRRMRAKTAPNPINTPGLKDQQLISYHELVRATDNFSEANLLGRGSFGSVFRGYLDDGLLVAIKVLNLEDEGASRSFAAECQILSLVRHRNLVKIISTCSNLDYKVLVLQFMPNGSLERWLYSHNYCLSLLQRIDILLDVASALEHLHYRHAQVVVHCDVKPNNVLLDEDMTAHLGDFGIAKLFQSDAMFVASASATPGTIGYMAPEYAAMGRISTSIDVYSFGILALETLTRKKPTDTMFGGESNLRQWACEAYPAAVSEIVDCNLLEEESGNSAMQPEEKIARRLCMTSIIELGLLCSKDSPKERILIKDVVPRLQKIKKKYLSMLSAA